MCPGRVGVGPGLHCALVETGGSGLRCVLVGVGGRGLRCILVGARSSWVRGCMQPGWRSSVRSEPPGGAEGLWLLSNIT
jgi:hypothetical protein